MQRISISLFFIICSVQCFAQNVISNCSFENYTTCPVNAGQIANCVQWRGYNVSPDYYHGCNTASVGVPGNWAGNEPAAHGQAYAGFVDYYGSSAREYIATTFPPLVINVTYEVSLSVSLSDNSQAASNGLGVYFYQNGLNTVMGTTLLPVTPQVSFASSGPFTNKNGWVRVTRTFVADSAYTNLVIGGFLSNAQMTIIPSNPAATAYAYYYVDSVVVRMLSPIQINFTGTQLCRGTTIQVPYIVTTGIFNTGNVFNLQLSDASGSFAAPVVIGSVASTGSGTVTAVIPAGVPIGTGYRLRVVSTNAVAVSDDNGSNITIAVPSVNAISNSPVCEGGNINLSATAVAGTGFSWTGPSSYGSTGANAVINNAIPANSGDYIVTGTLLGCTEKDTVTVVVNPLPVLNSVGNNGPLCEGETLHLTAQGTGNTYQWTGPASFGSTQQNPHVNNTTIGMQGSYTVTTSLNGCTSAPMNTTVVINETPVINNSSSNSPVCAGGILSLNAMSGTSGVSYEWKGPNGYMSQQQNPVINPAGVNHAGDYIVTASTTNCTSQPDTLNVVVTTIAYLGIYASPNDTICEGDSILFVTVPVNGGVAPSFQWYKNNVEIAGATGLKYSAHNLITGDSFYCRMIANNSCSTPITLFSEKLGVKVYAHTPAPTVSISSVPANPLPGNFVTFTANISNGGSNPQVQWLRNGQDIVGAINTIWSASNLNPYDKISVRVTSSEYCPDAKQAQSNEIEVNFPTGIHNISEQGWAIYPNPNDGTFRISGAVSGREAEVIVTNAIGQMVYRESVAVVNGRVDAKIVLPPAAPRGVYMLQLLAGGAGVKTLITVR